MRERGIVLAGVGKSFGKKRVLHEVDMIVPAGGIYGLLGPSGCGKSTVVKIMAGILEADSGVAYLEGERMPRLDLMAKVGYMAQADGLYMSLTAAENLQFFGAIYGLKRVEIKARSAEVMRLVDLSDHLHKPVHTYSGGMKRRLSLAVAILHRPSVLILDEPTVGIDPVLRQRIWQSLREMASQGVTIMLTTHVMDEAEKCNELAMMRDGVLIATGSPKELMASVGVASIEEAFIYYGGGQDAH